MAILRFEIGSGGWVKYSEGTDDVMAYVLVRFVIDPADGRARAAQAIVSSDDDGLTTALGESMRRVHWGLIEALANQPDAIRLLRSRIDEGITLALVRTEDIATQDVEAVEIGDTGDPVAAAIRLMSRVGAFPDDVMSGAALDAAAPWEPPKPLASVSPKMDVPDRGRYPDSFYEQFANVYSSLAAEGKSPAAVISAANGVNRSTVHRWAKEARRRGVLGPGRRGQVG